MGGAYREYRLDATRLFETNEGRSIRNYEYGGYAQLTKTVLNERLKLAAAGRLDEFKNFGRAFSPRASAVYSLGSDKQHNFRASDSRAFRSPTQYDQYVNIDRGAAVSRGNVGAGYQGYSTALGANLPQIFTSANPPAELAKYAQDVYMFQRTPARVVSKPNPLTHPTEWEKIAYKPGWQAERRDFSTPLMRTAISLSFRAASVTMFLPSKPCWSLLFARQNEFRQRTADPFLVQRVQTSIFLHPGQKVR